MEAAIVDKKSVLVCVIFGGNALVKIEPTTGKTERIYTFAPLSHPAPYRLNFISPPSGTQTPLHSATVNHHSDRVSSSYYALLEDPVEYQWVEIDVKKGTLVSKTKIFVHSLPGPLSLSQYVN